MNRAMVRLVINSKYFYSIASVSIHLIVLLLFIMSKHPIAPAGSAEVIIQDMPQPQTQLQPQQSAPEPAQQHDEPELIQGLSILEMPGAKQNTQQSTTEKAPTPVLAQTHEIPHNHLYEESQKSIHPDKSTKNVQSETLEHAVSIKEIDQPTLMSDIKAPEEIAEKKDNLAESSYGIRKRKLTIFDLFNGITHQQTFSHKDSGEYSQAEDGSGAPAVIVQGDIKYHSFIQSIVNHINAVSNFNNRQSVIGTLIIQGAVKNNFVVSISIDKAGYVTNVRTITSSGCKNFDDFWTMVIYKSSPFMPLPDHFKRDSVRVELTTQLG